MLLGYLDADDDCLRNNLIVIPGGKKPFLVNGKMVKSPEKGEETMKKNCYKRKDGRWVYAKQENGMSYYAIAGTYRELLEKIKNIKPKQKKILVNQKKTATTFVQYCQYFFDSYIKNSDINKQTKKRWQTYITSDITPVFKYIKLENVTTEQVQSFINSITFERKRETLFQCIVRILKKAYVTNKIKRDITLGLERPKRKNKQERHPLTWHEQIAFLKEAKKSRIYAFIIFSVIIGSRREETLKFNFATDVDEKKLTIHIRGTKTENADRYVQVTREFIQFLKANIKGNTFNFKKSVATEEVGKIFRRLNINACLHSLRHTCSANLYFLGARDKYRQLQLGHASIEMTNDVYTNIKENIPARYLRLIYGDLYPRF